MAAAAAVLMTFVERCARPCAGGPVPTNQSPAAAPLLALQPTSSPKQDEHGKAAKSEDEVKAFDTEFTKVDQGVLFELILVRWPVLLPCCWLSGWWWEGAEWNPSLSSRVCRRFMLVRWVVCSLSVGVGQPEDPPRGPAGVLVAGEGSARLAGARAVVSAGRGASGASLGRLGAPWRQWHQIVRFAATEG